MQTLHEDLAKWKSAQDIDKRKIFHRLYQEFMLLSNSRIIKGV